MSAVATEYVRRHVSRFVSPTKDAVLLKYASVANDQGMTVGYYQHDVAADQGCSIRTAKYAIRSLREPNPGAPGPFLKKHGNGRYEVLGVKDHDRWTCGNDECRGEAEAVSTEAGESPAERKRRKTAERVRKLRARRSAQGLD